MRACACALLRPDAPPPSIPAARRRRAQVKRAEVRILKLVPPGSSMPTSRVKEALARAGYDDSTVNNALKIMERREEVALLNERKTVRRLK